jgi:MYXO-CTERM domain-containing protein
MRSTTGLAIASLLTLPALACGGVTARGISPEAAPKELAQAICPKAYDCCMTTQLMHNDQAGTDVATCEMKTQAGLESQVAGIEASEKNGRVIYDGTKVDACVKFLQSATCMELNTTGHFSGIPACASFIQPQVAAGGACAADFECIDGFCDKTGVASGQANGDGACRTLAKAGESCAAGVHCELGLTCDATSTTCAAPPVGGAPTADACFYSSACNYAGGDRGAASLLTVGLVLVAVWRRRRKTANAAQPARTL